MANLGNFENPSTETNSGPETSALDLDGNTMEVVYLPVAHSPEGYSGSTVRKTNPSEGEISRVMSWTHDVAAADISPRERFDPLDSASPGPVIRRTITTTTTTYEPVESSSSPRQSSNGLVAAGALVGLLTSAAIGAGVAYGVMKERTRQDFEPAPYQHRSTCPPPTISTRYPYSQAPRDVDGGYDDVRSRRSSRVPPPGTASVRARSEVSSNRKPLLLTDFEHQSNANSRTSEMDDVAASQHRSRASSRHTSAKSKHSGAPPSIRRSSAYDEAADADRETYMSSRSHRTASTVRGPPRPTVQTELTSLVSRPKTASRVSGSAAPRRADSYASARDTPPPASRAVSYVSARKTALPVSAAGGSRVEYGDDACSIAPSDSISCIGSRKASRVHC